MASASERRAGARGAPLVAPDIGGIDGLPGVGLDSNDDLMDALIDEAGEADEGAIIETGLPDGYDPDGTAFLGGAGRVGAVVRLGGGEAQASPEGTGSTRVGLLPKVPKTMVAVAPKIGGAPPAARAAGAESGGDARPDEDPEEDPQTGPGHADGPDGTPDDELPEGGGGTVRAAATDGIDPDLLAELSGDPRVPAPAVSPAARRAPTPAPAPPPAPAPAEPGPESPAHPTNVARMIEMNLEEIAGPAPARKCVLIVDPQTPGIENLRWKQLAARLTAQAADAGRGPRRPVEYMEVPAPLFNALFSAQVVERGPAVALSCLHQTEAEQVFVCTDAFFEGVLDAAVASTSKCLAATRREADHLAGLALSLALLQAGAGDE